MIVKNWDVTLIEFIIKFCNNKHKQLKIKFKAYDEDAKDIVIKTLVISEFTYVPDSIRDYIVSGIDVDNNYLVIKIDRIIDTVALQDMKKRNYTFDSDEYLGK